MLSCLTNRPIIINKKLSDYCKKTMNESIKNIGVRYNLERNQSKIKNIINNDDEEKPKFNIYNFLIFLSISTITIYFYKRLK